MLKTITTLTAICFALTFVLSPVSAVRAEDIVETEITTEGLPATETIDLEVGQPSVLPGTFWYPAKQFFEKLQETLTVLPESRAKLQLKLANKRLAEVQTMIAKGKTELLEKTISEYQERVQKAEEKLGAIDTGELLDTQKDRLELIKELFSENYLKHIRVLEKVNEKIENSKAKEAIEENIIRSREMLEKRLGEISPEDAEKARERLSQMLENVSTDETDEANYLDTLRRFGANISDPQLRERIRTVQQEKKEKIEDLVEEGEMTIEKGKEVIETIEGYRRTIQETQEKIDETREKVNKTRDSVSEKLNGIREGIRNVGDRIKSAVTRTPRTEESEEEQE